MKVGAEFAAQVRAMHAVAHQPMGSDDPGLTVYLPVAQLALINLGLLLTGRAFPCLQPQQQYLAERLNELWDFQFGDADGGDEA